MRTRVSGEMHRCVCEGDVLVCMCGWVGGCVCVWLHRDYTC